jgi:hypothetical protein
MFNRTLQRVDPILGLQDAPVVPATHHECPGYRLSHVYVESALVLVLYCDSLRKNPRRFVVVEIDSLNLIL